ncbi:MAG: LysR family transcriptional regulator [Deltaproteobacteria bacterium]|nr:MAG: LysR family transcriptional regulator [Deltaproteobacteria bacterium]
MEHVEKLLIFRDIVEQHSISGAARHWNMSHSTVSRHLKSLELYLNTQLLHRTSRTMELTEEGRIVYDASCQISNNLEDLKQRLLERRGVVQGELRINSLVHVGRYFVQPYLQSFCEMYPNVRISLVLDDGPVNMTQGKFDLAIRVGLPNEASLTVRKLADNPVCLAASPALVKRWGKPQKPSELSLFPTVAYSNFQGDIDTWSYVEGEEIRVIQVTPVCRVNEGNALLQAVLDGLGIGYLSTFAAQPEFATGKLVPILPNLQLPPYAPVYLVRPFTEYISPKVEAFKQHLIQAIG